MVPKKFEVYKSQKHIPVVIKKKMCNIHDESARYFATTNTRDYAARKIKLAQYTTVDGAWRYDSRKCTAVNSG